MQRPVWGPILKGYMCPFSCRTATCGCMLRHIQQVQAQLQGPLTDTTANTSLFGGHFVVTKQAVGPKLHPTDGAEGFQAAGSRKHGCTQGGLNGCRHATGRTLPLGVKGAARQREGGAALQRREAGSDVCMWSTAQ